jgi:hypothetical protein
MWYLAESGLPLLDHNPAKPVFISMAQTSMDITLVAWVRFGGIGVEGEVSVG